MLAHLENELNKSGKNGLAEVVKGVRVTLGRDIPFPISEPVSSLEQTTEKYKENPNNPECLTQLMRSYWIEADKKNNTTTVVPEFPLKSKDIKERARQKQMAVFNGVDWIWIEKSVDAPNLGTNEFQLREKAEKSGRQIMSLETYRAGGEINKLLSGKYFDEGDTLSRVIRNGQVVLAYFDSDGHLYVFSSLDPGRRNEHLGGRFEEVIRV